MSSDVRSLKALAAQRLREGRMAEAADLFEQLTTSEPSEPDHWYNLGYSRRMARDYNGALDAYAEALRRNVRGAEDVYVNRAAILSEHLHDVRSAAAELRRAVAANPRAISAWLNLGGLYEDLGDSEAAREAYAKAQNVDPACGRAAARMAAIDVHEGQWERAIRQLRSIESNRWSTPQDAAEVQFALGNALDAAGEHAAAFNAIVEANRLGLAGRHPSVRYDAEAQERLVDALIAMPATASAATLPEAENPIFICGMFRSGSTLIEQLLSRHPKVTAGGELEFIPALVREDLEPYPRALVEASRERLTVLRNKYLEQVRRLYPDAGRITDKRPDNFLHIGLIKALFPAAPIVHTIRGPLDNILSAFFLYFGDQVSYSLRLDEIAHYYAQYRRLMDHWRDRFEGGIHDVDYDALVAAPRAELERLLGFLGLEWDEACLNPVAREAVRTASNWQVRRPLHSKSSGRWKNYGAELEGVRQSLAEAGLI